MPKNTTEFTPEEARALVARSMGGRVIKDPKTDIQFNVEGGQLKSLSVVWYDPEPPAPKPAPPVAPAPTPVSPPPPPAEATVPATPAVPGGKKN